MTSRLKFTATATAGMRTQPPGPAGGYRKRTFEKVGSWPNSLASNGSLSGIDFDVSFGLAPARISRRASTLSSQLLLRTEVC
jgi:hypothetical protein